MPGGKPYFHLWLKSRTASRQNQRRHNAAQVVPWQHNHHRRIVATRHPTTPSILPTEHELWKHQNERLWATWRTNFEPWRSSHPRLSLDAIPPPLPYNLAKPSIPFAQLKKKKFPCMCILLSGHYFLQVKSIEMKLCCYRYCSHILLKVRFGLQPLPLSPPPQHLHHSPIQLAKKI